MSASLFCGSSQQEREGLEREKAFSSEKTCRCLRCRRQPAAHTQRAMFGLTDTWPSMVHWHLTINRQSTDWIPFDHHHLSDSLVSSLPDLVLLRSPYRDLLSEFIPIWQQTSDGWLFGRQRDFPSSHPTVRGGNNTTTTAAAAEKRDHHLICGCVPASILSTTLHKSVRPPCFFSSLPKTQRRESRRPLV